MAATAGAAATSELVAEAGLRDLARFRTAVHHKAEHGAGGASRNCHGKAGSTLSIPVPVGTRVLRDGKPIATLDEHGQRVSVARGGGGGAGNRAFRSSTNRAPRTAIPGVAGEETWLNLVLVLPVAVAIVGLPNSGKTALLNALTGARAPVAAFPHTTTEPELGMLEDDAGHTWLVADLPGVATDGEPRPGHHLGQLERARILLHCVSASAPEPWRVRVELLRRGLTRFAPEGIHEIMITTKADEGDGGPPGAREVVAEVGLGIDELRAEVISALGGA